METITNTYKRSAAIKEPTKVHAGISSSHLCFPRDKMETIWENSVKRFLRTCGCNANYEISAIKDPFYKSKKKSKPSLH